MKRISRLLIISMLCSGVVLAAEEPRKEAQKEVQKEVQKEAQTEAAPVPQASIDNTRLARIRTDAALASPVSEAELAPVLQAGPEPLQDLQQAGVCSVITGYLQTVCLQNASDQACQPYN